MPPTSPASARKTFPALPWRKLTDAEYAALRALLPGAAAAPGRRRGRPPADLRRTLDAVCWIAASAAPWRALPAALGKPDSVHRALCRWAQAGVLERMLRALAAGNAPALEGIGHWICRAFRRMARRLPDEAVAEAERLGVVDAWPARTLRFPNEHLSERARFHARTLRSHHRVFRDILCGLRLMPSDCPPVRRLMFGMPRLFVSNDRMLAIWQGEWRKHTTSNRQAWTLR